jgi:hypothetical protein
MPLFNFTLTPLEKVPPWGKLGDLSLHWFGLTDGIYWLGVGDEKLFEYHPDNPWGIDSLRFVDYQIARLYEDILEMVPAILEPVSKSLQADISGDGLINYLRAFDEWSEQERDDAEFWELRGESMILTLNRILDSGYLTAAPKIWLWSDGTNVHVEWDNRERLHKGKSVWSAQQGEFLLTRAAFIAEVRDFHNRLMQQMQERVDQVCAGALPPEVRIDLTALREEHERRSASIEAHFAPPAEPTDWEAVERAIAEIKRPRAR